jgi:hypothetical protein
MPIRRGLLQAWDGRKLKRWRTRSIGWFVHSWWRARQHIKRRELKKLRPASGGPSCV